VSAFGCTAEVGRWAASLLLCLSVVALAACERPPEPPPTEVELEQEEDELSEQIEQTRAEARKRAQAVEERVPDADAGTTDDPDADAN
jgi:hypothetical protein